MALVFCDGFDSYAATADLTKKWWSIGSPWAWSAGADQNGATGGILSCVNTAIGINPPLNLFGPTGAQRVAVGYWLKVSAIPTANSNIIFYGNSIGQSVGSINILTTSGFLRLLTNIGGQVFVGTTNVCDNAWHWVEIASQLGTNALQRCLVDGVSQWNGNGTMFASAGSYIDNFAFYGSPSRTISISDPIIYDDNGTTFTVAGQFPLGTRKITTLRPDGDDSIQFTRSTGSTNFSLVDELNGDITDYVESNTPEQQDTYDYTALGFTPTTVNAVVLNSFVQTSTAGSVTYKPVAKSGGVVALGDNLYVPPAPSVKQQPFFVDPNTAVAWTESGINAAKFGIKATPLHLTYTGSLTALEYEQGGGLYAGLTLAAIGGVQPYTYSKVSGTLPTGFSLNATTGVLSGTPVAGSEGTYPSLVFRVTDANSTTYDLAALTLTINYADLYYANVVLLAGFNGTNGQITYSEEKFGRAATFFGGGANLCLSSAQAKFGTTSFRNSGSGAQQIQFGDVIDWQLGTGATSQYTIEGFVYYNTITNAHHFILGQSAANGTVASQLFLQQNDTANLRWGTGDATGNVTFGLACTSNEISTGRWIYFLVHHSATDVCRIFIDGVMRAKTTAGGGFLFNSLQGLGVTSNSGGNFPSDCWLDELRITKGTCRQDSDSSFTPPTRPFPRQ